MLNRIDLTRVDLNLLVLFEAVYEARHVGKAARTLHVSSSAVSHGLGRLRELLGDPLFLKAPKGVVPTSRAVELAPMIADVLLRVRGVMGSVERFDPATSARRFSIAASDATAAVLLPGLIATLRREAPRIDLSTRNVLPNTGLQEIDAGTADLAILPLDEAPPRFFTRVVHEDEFVVAARAKHPFLRRATLRRYCDALHVVVSITGDSTGFVDQELATKGLSRRVALSVPNFMLALAALSETDLLAAMPVTLLSVHAKRFGLASVRMPLPLRRWEIRAAASTAAMKDPGVAWLLNAVERTARSARRDRHPGTRDRPIRGGSSPAD